MHHNLSPVASKRHVFGDTHGTGSYTLQACSSHMDRNNGTWCLLRVLYGKSRATFCFLFAETVTIENPLSPTDPTVLNGHLSPVPYSLLPPVTSHLLVCLVNVKQPATYCSFQWKATSNLLFIAGKLLGMPRCLQTQTVRSICNSVTQMFLLHVLDFTYMSNVPGCLANLIISLRTSFCMWQMHIYIYMYIYIHVCVHWQVADDRDAVDDICDTCENLWHRKICDDNCFLKLACR